MKSFKTGIIVGRFEHIHIGHEKLINIGLDLCDILLVFVSAAQESNALLNPYNIEYRINLINKIYNEEINKGQIIVVPLDDVNFKKGVSQELGKYIFDKSKIYLGDIPECIIYGKDKDILKCFSKDEIENVSEIIIDRKKLQISATKIREYILSNDINKWKEFVNEKIYDEYYKLKEILDKIYCKK